MVGASSGARWTAGVPLDANDDDSAGLNGWSPVISEESGVESLLLSSTCGSGSSPRENNRRQKGAAGLLGFDGSDGVCGAGGLAGARCTAGESGAASFRKKKSGGVSSSPVDGVVWDGTSTTAPRRRLVTIRGRASVSLASAALAGASTWRCTGAGWAVGWLMDGGAVSSLAIRSSWAAISRSSMLWVTTGGVGAKSRDAGVSSVASQSDSAGAGAPIAGVAGASSRQTSGSSPSVCHEGGSSLRETSSPEGT